MISTLNLASSALAEDAKTVYQERLKDGQRLVALLLVALLRRERAFFRGLEKTLLRLGCRILLAVL